MAQEIKEQKKKNKKEKGNFVKEIMMELKKVVWPGKKQLANNTVTVLILCAIVGVLIWLLDLGFQQIYAMVFN